MPRGAPPSSTSSTKKRKKKVGKGADRTSKAPPKNGRVKLKAKRTATAIAAPAPVVAAVPTPAPAPATITAKPALRKKRARAKSVDPDTDAHAASNGNGVASSVSTTANVGAVVNKGKGKGKGKEKGASTTNTSPSATKRQRTSVVSDPIVVAGAGAGAGAGASAVAAKSARPTLTSTITTLDIAQVVSSTGDAEKHWRVLQSFMSDIVLAIFTVQDDATKAKLMAYTLTRPSIPTLCSGFPNPLLSGASYIPSFFKSDAIAKLTFRYLTKEHGDAVLKKVHRDAQYEDDTQDLIQGICNILWVLTGFAGEAVRMGRDPVRVGVKPVALKDVAAAVVDIRTLVKEGMDASGYTQEATIVQMLTAGHRDIGVVLFFCVAFLARDKDAIRRTAW